jgi:agmatine deiminase
MTKFLDTLPIDDGFYFPAEFEPHEGIWMCWPTRPDNWREGGRPAQQAFVEVASTIAKYTKVTMVVPHEEFDHARKLLPAHVKLLEMSFNDAWMRDIGAMYLVNGRGQRRGVSWQFNAWGGELDGLYEEWDLDNAAAKKMLNATEDDIYQAPMVLEGGSVHTDGEGTLFTTKECLLHPSRNPGLTQQQIEQHLQNYLGAEKVIWLPKGLDSCDETNGHVDMILQVARPGEVLLAWSDNPSQDLYHNCRAAHDVLANELDAKGRNITIHKLHAPEPLYRTDQESTGISHTENMARSAGEKLAGSYCNFLITNRAVIFPLLDPNTDKHAHATLKDVFPEHQVIGLPTREIILGGGNIHCITQQVPQKAQIGRDNPTA